MTTTVPSGATGARMLCASCERSFSSKPSEQAAGSGPVTIRYRWSDGLVVNGRIIRKRAHPTVCSEACRAKLLADRSWLRDDVPTPLQWDEDGACSLPGSLCHPNDICRRCGRAAREHPLYVTRGDCVPAAVTVVPAASRKPSARRRSRREVR